MKEKRAAIWKRILAVVLTVAALLPVWGVQTAKAAENIRVSIQVQYKPLGVTELLTKVNELRRGLSQPDDPGAETSGTGGQERVFGMRTTALSELAYDNKLETAALVRAAEIALVYSSENRPNGKTISDAYPASSPRTVESISMASSAEEVYRQWFTSGADYKNMTNSAFKAMGIGHIVYNGTDYWVAAFSDLEKSVSDSPSSDNNPHTQQIEVSPTYYSGRVETGLSSSLTLNVGETKNFKDCKAIVEIGGKTFALPADTPRVTSGDPATVSVNGTEIKALKVGVGGPTNVTISCGGQTATIYVTVQQPQLTIDTIPNQNYTGYAITPTVTVRQGNTTLRPTTDYTVQYSNNTSVGTAYVYVTGQGSYSGNTLNTTFRIVTPSVANATITTIPDQAFTGNPIYPMINVYDNGRMLQQGVDYDVTYSNNTNMGTATVMITGRGTYTGTKTATFRITGQNLNTATIDAIPDQIYTGSYITPAVTVRLNNLTLSQNVDYSVSYQNNRNIGTATVTVTGRGNYSGTRMTTFRILDRDLNYATLSSIPNQRYTGREICPNVTVTLGGTVLRQNVDYTVSYQNNRQPGTATVIVTGAGSYRGSKSTTFKITQMSISSATVKAANQTYNGDEKEPNVTVRLNGELLEEGDDYEVEYRNNTKPGKATVVIYGNGYYSGTAKTTFVIKPKKQTLKSGKAQGNSAALVWTRDSNVKGYEIYRSRRKSSGYSRIGTFTTNKTTACRNTRLSRGTYYYKIRSYIVVGGKKYYGAFSNVKRVTIR